MILIGRSPNTSSHLTPHQCSGLAPCQILTHHQGKISDGDIVLNRSHLQHFSKAFSKPTGDMSCVQGKEKEFVSAAIPPVDRPWVSCQHPFDGGSSLLCTAQKLELGFVGFPRPCMTRGSIIYIWKWYEICDVLLLICGYGQIPIRVSFDRRGLSLCG